MAPVVMYVVLVVLDTHACILSECPFADSRYVDPHNVDEEVKKGGFLRIYCEHDGRWCDAEFGSDCCAICTDHLNE